MDIPNNPLKNLNAYLIKGRDRSLLIDTGFDVDVCRRCLTEGLSELGVAHEELDFFATHFHSDHTAIIHRLSCEDTRIYISETDEKYWRFFSGDEGREDSKRRYLTRGFPPEELGSVIDQLRMHYYHDLDGKFTFLSENDQIEYGGHKLRIISTPGHTPGHLCLLDEEAEMMFTGDHVLFDITPNIAPYIGFEDPLGHYLDSLRKVKDFPVRTPLPAHRGVHTGLRERIGELIAHHQERLEEVIESLRQYGPLNADELASHLHWRISARSSDWAEVPFQQRWFASGEAVTHLDYLIKRGEVGSDLENGVVIYHLK